MDPSLRTSASGMMAQQTRIEVIANNLANVNTTGFKRSRAHFEDLLYQTVQGATASGDQGVEALPGVQLGRGTRLAAVRRMDGQGSIAQTGRPLDLAVEGDGYFQVELPNGSMAYTRDGSFSLSDQGSLITHGGYSVVPGVNLPGEPGQVTISTTGVVSFQSEANGGDPIEIGRVELARFTNPTGLEALGENLFSETSASGPALAGFPQDSGFGRVLSGALEASNVEIVQEMVDMIAALRAYEIGSRALQSSEEMSQITAQLGRHRMRAGFELSLYDLYSDFLKVEPQTTFYGLPLLKKKMDLSVTALGNSAMKMPMAVRGQSAASQRPYLSGAED